ncbi:MAG: TIGR00300 family protein [Candidatus Obscuribacterales bacterium]|nr:TIGR00300 family protein [Candidatus Obscuribacterales bacterium]
MFSETVQAEGHLIDSDILTKIFDIIIACESTYEVLEFQIGKTNDEVSRILLSVNSKSKESLEQALGDLLLLGCRPIEENDAHLKPAEKNACVPDDFYSTTNHRTTVRHQGQWLTASAQRMDAVICIENGQAICRKLRDVKKGDSIVCGHEGIRVMPEFKERDRMGFAFMSNEISSERRVETSVKKIAEMMRQIKKEKGKIVFVSGPVVIHTGGSIYLSQLIKSGYVSALLSGNALAVHDIENALFGTSLGVDLEHGLPIHEGHKNHMRAINTINRAGSIPEAVKQGILKSGVMHDCVKANIPFILAGSIRDDGPLPETLMDLVQAQDQYAKHLQDAHMVICLSSMLHSIAVGNMLPSWVKTVCVDINPAVVTKLSDRGSAQAIGIVTDVGLFVNMLARELAN